MYWRFMIKERGLGRLVGPEPYTATETLELPGLYSSVARVAWQCRAVWF